MGERRNYVRMMLSGVFSVYDKPTQTHLGRIANLSKGGLMLVGPAPIQPGVTHLLEIRYTGNDGRTARISVTADSVWCQPSGRDDQYGVGFTFTRVSPEGEAALGRLMGL